jgi:release factor glutamine methyltransferase
MTGPISPCSVGEALRWAAARLADTSEPVLAARLLLAHVLGLTLTDLFVHPERVLTEEQTSAYQALIARRAQHEPVAYLTGHRAFLDLDLLVDKRVLIPRPETECLVELAIAAAMRWSRPRVADVGTGSGAVAISLARHLPAAQVYAIDCSPDALKVARENARRYSVCDRVLFMQGDLLAPLPEAVNVIVANLPYVAEAERAGLSPDVSAYEPAEALFSGEDGLSAIRALLDTARPYLTADGLILLEIGADQGDRAAQIAALTYPGAQIEVHTDHARRDRVLRVDLNPV